MDNKYLSLFFDAPLQSWGYQSKFDWRTSLSYPTRSGIIGIISAAMGVDRKDVSNLDRLNFIRISIYVFKSGNRLIDFHTVGGGWDKEKNSQCIVPKANGSLGDTVVTYREYLQDAKYGVIISGNCDFIDEIAMALRNPKWGVWLGRKSCIPAELIFQGVFDSEEKALLKLREKVGGLKETRIIKEVDKFEEGNDTLLDRPIDFSRRKFTPRRVYIDINEDG